MIWKKRFTGLDNFIFSFWNICWNKTNSQIRIQWPLNFQMKKFLFQNIFLNISIIIIDKYGCGQKSITKLEVDASSIWTKLWSNFINNCLKAFQKFLKFKDMSHITPLSFDSMRNQKVCSTRCSKGYGSTWMTVKSASFCWTSKLVSQS